jgi:hypothetical protein
MALFIYFFEKKYIIIDINMDNPVQKENKRNKIFFIIFFSLIFLSVAITFYKIVIIKNYQIVAQVSCNPITEKCFETICDPATDDTCEASSTIYYYKNISKNAGVIYTCEKTSEKVGCAGELSCTTGESNCFYTYCDPTQLLDGEKCSE